jgi:hypothetical protein
VRRGRLQRARRRAAAEQDRPKVEAPAWMRVGEWPTEPKTVAVERYTAGESGEAVAEDLGLGQWRVYKLLRTLSEASALREERRRRPEN